MIVFLLANQISCIAAYVALRSSIVKKMFYSYDVGGQPMLAQDVVLVLTVF